MTTNNATNTGNPITVAQGGSGVATMTTAYAPVCAGTTATGALQVASTGLSTSGWVLTSNGSSALPTFQAASGSGALTWLASVTASSSATVDFANKLSSTYDNYLVVWENVVPATASVQLQCRVGTGATPTWQSSSYNGVCFGTKNTTNVYSPQASASGTSAIDLIPSDVNSVMDNTSTNACGGYLYLTNVNNSSNNKSIVSQVCYIGLDVASDKNVQFYNAAGQWQSSTVLTSIRFLMSSGNISTGTFKLYGLQN